jgi:hypothetical protein
MAGNNNVHRGPSKDKRIRAALNRLIDADPRRLDEFAEKWWAIAMSGDSHAMNSIADRLDGKVPQAVVGDTEHPPVGVEQIQRVIVDSSANPDSASIPSATGASEV